MEVRLNKLTAKQVIRLLEKDGVEPYMTQLMTEIDFSKKKWEKLCIYITRRYLEYYPYLSSTLDPDNGH